MKKIIITESQLQTIYLNLKEAEESRKDILLYEDENVKFTVNVDAKADGIVVPMGDNKTTGIKVFNKSDAVMVLTAKGGEEWGYRGETDLTFAKQPIKPGTFNYIHFTIDGNKQKLGGYNRSTIYVTYILSRKLTKDVRLSIPWTNSSEEQTINYCKQKFNNAEFQNAKTFLLNWLKEPITITKYMKNWELSLPEVQDIFDDYTKTIKNAFLEYTSKPNEWFLARVQPRNFNELIDTAKWVPIQINCVQSMLDGHKESVRSILVHEMQHLLNLVHPWQPDKKSATVSGAISDKSSSILDKITSFFGGRQTLKKDIIIERLVKDGFDEYIATDIASMYERQITDGDHGDYTTRPNELSSFILGFREQMNLQSGQDITPEQLIKYRNDAQGFWLVMFYVRSGIPLRTFLSMINSYADAKIPAIGRKDDTANAV
jgi:hypothetical protein